MKTSLYLQRGYTLLELMVAMTIGIFLVGAVIVVYSVQSQVYKGTNAQASIQDAENAIAALMTPVVRAAGFDGCSTITAAVSNLNGGAPNPLGALATTPAMIIGYDYANTGGAATTLTITADNTANDTTASNWSPALDSALVGNVLPGSDVLVILGAAPGSHPVGVTGSVTGSNSISLSDTSGFSVGDFAAVSDCLKSSVFKVTSITPTTLVHDVGSGTTDNATAALSLNYPVGAQATPLRQTAFFVGHGAGGQSALMRATLVGSVWNAEQLVPGVETMQVLYGIGAAAPPDGLVTQYVPASAVADWTLVYSIRLAFLLEGRVGSGAGAPASAPLLLGTTVTPPADTILRHVYEMTISLRNSS